MATYADVGIHLDDSKRTKARLGDLVARTRGAGVLADVGAFGGMFRLGAAGAFRDPVLVASTDGIGTKVKIAAALGRYESLGTDIVNHCLNDIAVHDDDPVRGRILRGRRSWVPAVLRYTAAQNALLLEKCNLANPQDRELLVDRKWREAFARAVVEGMAEAFNSQE